MVHETLSGKNHRYYFGSQSKISRILKLLQNPKVPKIVLGLSNHAKRFTPPYYLDVDNQFPGSLPTNLKMPDFLQYLLQLQIDSLFVYFSELIVNLALSLNLQLI